MNCFNNSAPPTPSEEERRYIHALRITHGIGDVIGYLSHGEPSRAKARAETLLELADIERREAVAALEQAAQSGHAADA